MRRRKTSRQIRDTAINTTEARRIHNPIPQSPMQHRLALSATIFGVIGGMFLIILSAMNDYNFGTVHWSSTLIFVIATLISCILTTIEMILVAKKSAAPFRAKIHHSSIAKIVLFVLGIICVAIMIAFQATCGASYDDSDVYSNEVPTPNPCNRDDSIAAVFEWVVAFILFGYFSTLIVDMRKVRKVLPKLRLFSLLGPRKPDSVFGTEMV
jgi:heme/copper-type cytochrome/quinol oxidase subunit 2